MKNNLIKYLKKTPTKFNMPLENVLSEQAINNIADSLIATTPKNHCVSCGAELPLEHDSHICKSCQAMLERG